MRTNDLHINCTHTPPGAGKGRGTPSLRPFVPSSLRPSRGSASRPAFTLTELVITVALLALMMTLAGQVFSLSVQTTNQAQALMDVSQSLRLLERSLRKDLAEVDPARSMMVIQANPVAAYWTRDGRDGDIDADDADKGPLNGYPHIPDPEREDVTAGINGASGPPWALEKPRADVLMFFTSRRANSTVYPSVHSSLVQVVYGHAELGEFATDGSWDVDPLPFVRYDPADPVPFWDEAALFRDRYFARNWHLARREVLLVDAELDLLQSLGVISNDEFNDITGLRTDADFQWINDLTETFRNDPELLALSDGALDFVTLADGDFDYVGLVVDSRVLDRSVISVGNRQRWYRRSRLDLTPPAQLADRMGQYFLPNCASFKVEWALSHPAAPRTDRVIWVDPADAYASVSAELRGNPLANFFVPRSGNRFDETTLELPAAHGFYARDPDPTVAPSEPDPFFPKALRITVDVYDESDRFDRPFRHVMVIPVGSSVM